MTTFHKKRPPGMGVDSRGVAAALPPKLRKKVCLRTIRNRLKEKGYAPKPKVEKNDLSRKCRSERMAFCQAHAHKSGEAWRRALQGCGDIKDFTYYPRSMRARFTRYSAPWTYMTKAERYKPAFVRPKRMFKRCEFKKTQKGKVFAVTTSTGKLLMVHCPLPFDSDAFARIVRRRVGPFFVKEFPDRRKRVLLLDGEPLFHAPPAQAAFKEFGLSVLPRWPPYSPDLNPAEHLWPWIEAEMRKMEPKTSSFEEFKQHVLRAGAKYPSKEKLIPSMARRMKECIAAKGAMIKR